ncbi:MAG: hypothetical protein IKG18_00910 [Atopobiaceae bacterium]|nr:hypothetical protein [Atopobiaceae bacterium]
MTDVMEQVKTAWDALAKLSEITTTTEQSELLESAFAGLALAHDGLMAAKEKHERRTGSELADRAQRATMQLRFVEAAIGTGHPLGYDNAGNGLAFLLDDIATAIEAYIDNSRIVDSRAEDAKNE